jgi:alkanesulfonate monooxygenase SsuD/methylene tetrahydromethanopterin reductase-like flavin-dependent oxidoreductase (luciferase family)
MALKDRVPFGISLPHRSPDPIPMTAVRQVAQRAEAVGFRDLWVTDNALDQAFSFDSLTILTYAAAITTTIRVGVSVIVLPVQHPVHVAHRVATLDYASNGRAMLGVGLGREHHYTEFEVPTAQRVRRFREGVELIKAVWTEPKLTYRGSVFHVEGGMALRPVQKPHPPIWIGGDHPDAVRRTATLGDAWMGSGGSSVAVFSRCVPILKEALEKAGRDPATFPISKRVFLSVHERAEAARAELDRWFTTVYHNPAGTDASGIHGTPEQVRARLEELVAMGANHLLLNPVARYVEQVDMLASVVGLA